MTLSDKILNLFGKYGALSSERVTSLLEKECKIKRDVRTIQRHISDLVDKEKLVQLPSKGREQLYVPCRKKPSAISEFFLNRFWEELFDTRKELYKPRKEFGDNVFDAFIKLRSLVKMLPKNLKVEIMPDMEKFGTLPKEAIEEMKKKLDPGTVELLGEEEALRIKIEVKLEEEMEKLIDKVSTLLHEELKNLVKKKGS